MSTTTHDTSTTTPHASPLSPDERPESWATLTVLLKQRESHTRLYERAPAAFHAAAAEHALLERLTCDGVAAYRAALGYGVSSATFADTARAATWLLLGECLEQATHVDGVLFASRCELRPHLASLGVQPVWNGVQQVTSTTPLSVLLSELRAVERRRAVQLAALKIVHEGARLDRDALVDQLDQIAQLLRDEAPDEDTAEGRAAAEAEYSAMMGELHEHEAGVLPDLLPTGMAALDELLAGGMAPGQVYHVAAPEKTGKSQLTIAILAQCLVEREDCAVDLFSAEMSYREVLAALTTWNASALARMAGCAVDQLSRVPTTSRLLSLTPQGPGESERLHGAMALADRIKAPLERFRYKQAAGQTVEWVVSEARRRIASHRAQHGATAPYLVVVDYGQDLSTAARTHSDTKEQETISRALRALAKRERVTVLVVLHTGGAPDARPTAHIHGSKQWAKDTTGLIVLWRPCQGIDEPWQWMRAEVMRNRRGHRGHVDLHADVSRCHFEPWQGGTPGLVMEVLEQQERALTGKR